jgi:hypothetical protein
MKKIIAILLALSLMFVFVACNNDTNNDPTETQTQNTTEDQAVNSGDVDVEEPSTDETGEEPSTDENGEEPSTDKLDDKEDKEDENNKEEDTTKKEERPADPAKWSKEQIVEYYKQSAIKSHPTATSSQTMELLKLVVNDGDGALNFFLNMIKPAIKTVIKNNAISYNGITGGFKNLKASDVKSAKAYKQGNYTVVELYMVEQVDGIYGDSQSGTVGHAINVLGNIATAVEQFPQFDVKYKDADIKVRYANPTVKVKINDKGIIEKGTWSYVADCSFKHLEISGIMIDKAEAEIKYVIVVGGGF